MSTSEQNLSDEFEGELPAEEKPRLTFTQDVPPAIHYGHKLDMTDRDPVKMNDHVKVQKLTQRKCFSSNLLYLHQ